MYTSKEYGKIDHTHCPETDSPCGMKGKHRCCLCGEPSKKEPENCCEKCEVGFELGQRTICKNEKCSCHQTSKEPEEEFEDRYPDACLDCLAGGTHAYDSTWHKYAIKDAQDLYNAYRELKMEALSLLLSQKEIKSQGAREALETFGNKIRNLSVERIINPDITDTLEEAYDKAIDDVLSILQSNLNKVENK